MPGGYFQKKMGGDVRHAPWSPQLTLFQTWSPRARRVTGARDKLLRHVHGREMVLSPNDEEVANSSKKHTQFKTRGHKPYPISDQHGQNWYPISDQNEE